MTEMPRYQREIEEILGKDNFPSNDPYLRVRSHLPNELQNLHPEPELSAISIDNLAKPSYKIEQAASIISATISTYLVIDNIEYFIQSPIKTLGAAAFASTSFVLGYFIGKAAKSLYNTVMHG